MLKETSKAMVKNREGGSDDLGSPHSFLVILNRPVTLIHKSKGLSGQHK